MLINQYEIVRKLPLHVWISIHMIDTSLKPNSLKEVVHRYKRRFILITIVVIGPKDLTPCITTSG